jgi:4-amino-4-deoxy-L-arabinose transferase-like glycosyltransferase
MPAESAASQEASRSARAWLDHLIRRPWLGILLLLIFTLAFQGLRGLHEPDEGRYTAVAMRMLESGDWNQPKLHWEHPHWTKPPLTYWSIAASVALFGRNEFAARLPSSLSLLLTILLMVPLGRRFTPAKPYLPAVVYASMLLPFIASNVLTTDSQLALCETAGMAAFTGWAFGDTRRRLLLAGGFAAFGLAFLVKGPPGLLPALALLVWRFGTRGFEGSGRAFALVGLLIFLAVSLPWYLLVISRHPELLGYYLHDEVAARVLSGAHHRHSEWYGAFLVYLPSLLLGSMPWTGQLIAGMKQAGRRIVTERSRFWSRCHTETRFLLIWFFIPFAVFFIARSRLPLYVLPLMVPLALLVSRSILRGSREGQILPVWLPVWFAGLFLLRIAGGFIPIHSDARPLAEYMESIGLKGRSEYAFYGGKPVRALDFYLGGETEEVDPGELHDEFLEAEHPVWLFRKERSEELEMEMQEHGQRLTVLGQQGKWLIGVGEVLP